VFTTVAGEEEEPAVLWQELSNSRQLLMLGLLSASDFVLRLGCVFGAKSYMRLQTLSTL